MRKVTDAEIVGWIGRLGAAGVEHVAARFELERDVARERLSCLQREGMLGYAERRDDHKRLYWASATGLRECGLDRLGPWPYVLQGFDHAFQVAQVAVELARGLPGWQVLSAREIAVIEAESGERFGSVQVLEAGNWTTRLPALVLSSPLARVVPVEIEPRLGPVSSLLSICQGWAKARHVSRIYWLTQVGPGLAVRRAVREAVASDRITVLELDDLPLLIASECAREEASDVLL